MLLFGNELAEGDILAFDLSVPKNFLQRNENNGDPYVTYHKVVSVNAIPGNDSEISVTLQQYTTVGGAGDTSTHHVSQLGPCFVLVGNPDRLL
jgi:hypothetical protein